MNKTIRDKNETLARGICHVTGRQTAVFTFNECDTRWQDDGFEPIFKIGDFVKIKTNKTVAKVYGDAFCGQTVEIVGFLKCNGNYLVAFDGPRDCPVNESAIAHLVSPAKV